MAEPVIVSLLVQDLVPYRHAFVVTYPHDMKHTIEVAHIYPPDDTGFRWVGLDNHTFKRFPVDEVLHVVDLHASIPEPEPAQ